MDNRDMGNLNWEFCLEVKRNYPWAFRQVRVLDCGILDTFVNVRDLFERSKYYGVDLNPGDRTDVIRPVHELRFADGFFDTIISIDKLQYDQNYKLSLANMVRMLRAGGLLVFTCLTDGRRKSTKGDHRRKLTIRELCRTLELGEFEACGFQAEGKGVCFYGLKKMTNENAIDNQH